MKKALQKEVSQHEQITWSDLKPRSSDIHSSEGDRVGVTSSIRYREASLEREAQEEIMGTIYDKIYKKAELYLDTRQNDVHIQISYDFAWRLLVHYPEAHEDIVLPAILLHDVGWKMVPEEKQLSAFGPKVKDKKTQRLHEVEGVRIAEEILISLSYGEEKTREILTIVDGHDTRQEAVSLNDKLVKDADKLWRFTPAGVNIDHTRFCIPRDTYLDRLATMVDCWFFTHEAKDMAHEALNKAKSESWL